MTRVKKKDSARKKYYVFVLGTFLIFLIVSLLVFFYSIEKQIGKSARESAVRNITRKSAQIRSMKERQTAQMRALADYIGREEELVPRDHLTLLESINRQTGLGRIGIADGTGRMLYDNGETEDVSGQEFFRNVMAGEETVSVLTETETAGEERVILAVPIFSKDQVAGVLAGVYDVEGLSDLLFYGGYEEDGYVLIVAGNSTVVAWSFQSQVPESTKEDILADWSEDSGKSGGKRLEQALSEGQAGLLSVERDGVSYYLEYAPLGISDWMFVCAIPSGQAGEEFQFIKYAEAALFGVILVGVAVLLLSIRGIYHIKEETLIQVAQTDALTGLLNKQSTEEKIDQWLAFDTGLVPQAFLMMDIDRFKEINDVYGHVLGDEVLRRIGRLLREFFREGDFIGRIGGDEFVVLMKNIPSARQAMERAGQLAVEMKKIQIKGMEDVRLTVSMGLAICPDHGKTYLELYRCADEALYTIKRNGRDGCAMY